MFQLTPDQDILFEPSTLPVAPIPISPSAPTRVPRTLPDWLHLCPPIPPPPTQITPFVSAFNASSTIAQYARLNPQQRAIVMAPPTPTLVLAGAGTGKTHTLINRMAELVLQGLTSDQILLITFTRKAAEDMIHRTRTLLENHGVKIQGGTFHAVGLVLLKIHGHAIGLHPKFSLMDEDDAHSLIHLLASKRGFSTRPGFPKKTQLMSLFSRVANTLEPIADVIATTYPWMEAHTPQLTALYRSYTEAKWQQHRLDYDDLLLLLYKLLCLSESTRTRLGHQYQAILVDEYQDTTRVQAAIVQLLGSYHRNVMVVGDDAQSIFSFRGALVDSLKGFLTCFPDATIYRLEENYRSTQPILTVANDTLREAKGLIPKTLFTAKADGPQPILVSCNTEMAQAQFLVRSMIARHQEGVPYKDMAVLFRASSHSFEVEGLLNKHQIPYQKYGGLKLTDTAHVKDIVAYLRVADNPRDAGSWHRLLLLLDGVGAKLAQRLVDSMSETEDPISVLEQTTHKQRAALHRIAAVLRSAQNDAIHVSDRINLVLHHYAPILSRDYGTEAQQRMDDLRQLGQLSLSSPSLEVFLQDLTLNPDSSRPRNNPREQDLLTLSTIHSAKGLEWAHVYVMQLLDGYFPPIRSWYDDAALEEERRLFYVAITRPKDTLTLTYPVEQYHHMAHETLTQPCRFLRSTPPEHLQLLHIGDGT